MSPCDFPGESLARILRAANPAAGRRIERGDDFGIGVCVEGVLATKVATTPQSCVDGSFRGVNGDYTSGWSSPRWLWFLPGCGVVASFGRVSGK